MNSGFVGTRMVPSQAELQALLETHVGEQGWHFLRWAHRVSGFKQGIPTVFDCIEGQIFTGDRELRWKPQGHEFKVLFLSRHNAQSLGLLTQGFKPVAGDWITQDWAAHVYPPTETRLPKGIIHNGVDISQRYFIDQATWTVHFVALVAKEGQ